MATANGLYADRVRDIMNSKSSPEERAWMYKESVRAQKNENKIETLEEKTQIFQAQLLKSSLNSEEYLKKIAKYTKISAKETLIGQMLHLGRSIYWAHKILKFAANYSIHAKNVVEKIDKFLGKISRNVDNRKPSATRDYCCDDSGTGGRMRRTSRQNQRRTQRRARQQEYTSQTNTEEKVTKSQTSARTSAKEANTRAADLRKAAKEKAHVASEAAKQSAKRASEQLREKSTKTYEVMREKAASLRNKKLSQIDTKKIAETARTHTKNWTELAKKAINNVAKRGFNGKMTTMAESAGIGGAAGGLGKAAVGGAVRGAGLAKNVAGGVVRGLGGAAAGAAEGLGLGGVLAGVGGAALTSAGALASGIAGYILAGKYGNGDKIIGNGQKHSPLAKAFAGLTDLTENLPMNYPASIINGIMNSKSRRKKTLSQRMYDMAYDNFNPYMEKFDDWRHKPENNLNPRMKIGNLLLDAITGIDSNNRIMWNLLSSDKLREWYYGKNYKEHDPELIDVVKNSNKILKSLDGKSANLLKLTADQLRDLADYNNQTIGNNPPNQNQTGKIPLSPRKVGDTGMSADARRAAGLPYSDGSVDDTSLAQPQQRVNDKTSWSQRIFQPQYTTGTPGEPGFKINGISLGPFGTGFQRSDRLPDSTRFSTDTDDGPRLLPNSLLSVKPSPVPFYAQDSNGYNMTGGALGGLISSGEGNYGSYNRGVAGDARGKQIDFSQMTVRELQSLQSLPKNDPGRIFAFGKYQIIPSTMNEAVNSLGIDPNTKVTPELQEHIFRNYLIDKKRKNVKDYITGQSDDLFAAQRSLAKEFASVADPGTGRSRYGGTGGNRASISARKIADRLNKEKERYAANLAAGMSPEEAWANLSKPVGSNTGTTQIASSQWPFVDSSKLKTTLPEIPAVNTQVAGSSNIKPLDGLKNYRANGLKDVNGLIIHHTGGRGTPQGVVDTLNSRNLGINYVMDRDGTIYQTAPDGARVAHMKKGQGVGQGLSNDNTIGIEIIGKDDKDITPAQVQAATKFIDDMRIKYPNIGSNVYGHGEVNPHKQETEGHRVVEAYREKQLEDVKNTALAGLEPVRVKTIQIKPENNAKFEFDNKSLANDTPRSNRSLASLFGISSANAENGPTDDSLIKLRDSAFSYMNKKSIEDDSGLLKSRSSYYNNSIGSNLDTGVKTTGKGDRLSSSPSQRFINDRINAAFDDNYGTNRSVVSPSNSNPYQSSITGDMIQKRIEQAHNISASSVAEQIRPQDVRPSITDVSKPVTLSSDVDFSRNLPVQNETLPTSNTATSKDTISPAQVPHYPDPELMYPLLHYNLGG